MSRNLAFYLVAAVALSGIDAAIAVLAFRKKKETGNALGMTAAMAGINTMAYWGSIAGRNPGITSALSSVYFAGIDWMLVFLFQYTLLAAGMEKQKKNLLRAAQAIAALDSLVMAANIFTEIAVSFHPRSPIGLEYEMKPLYIAHLVFCYLILIAVVGVLLYKSTKTLRAYRIQYFLITAAIVAAVFLNALFLLPGTDSFITRFDHSALGYTIGLCVMYWAVFTYRSFSLMRTLSVTVVENINQGIVLFDNADELALCSQRARELLPDIAMEENMPRAEFLKQCGLPEMPGDMHTLQYDREEGKPIRCEFRRIRDRKNRPAGSLYIFTSIAREADNVTGFEYALSLRKYAEKNPDAFIEPTAIVVFDIISLREINRASGRDVGDAKIRRMAKAMRTHMPEGTAFFRGYEAQLIAVRIHMTEAEAISYATKAQLDCESSVLFGISSTAGNKTIGETLDIAYRDLQVKKLLSSGSSRSQTLSSLVKALEETDEETEAHVMRTQKMGEALGQKIGLSDAQVADLKLLCLLHDIGKIGVPLDILNKPGKLTEEEWAVLKTHPEKGYQIAMSVDELKPIADMILCHHERWDGKGYPKGLKGEAIPILSRMISIVDAYDAMVNDRCYRKALRPEVAQAEIRDNAGTQFDPDMAAAFLELLRERPEIAAGEVTGSSVSGFQAITAQGASTGNAKPILYSIYHLDADNLIIETDQNFEKITGFSSEEAVGNMTQFDLIPQEDRAFYMIQVQKQFEHGNIAYLQHSMIKKDGTQTQVVCYGERYFDSAAKALRSEIIVFEIDENLKFQHNL